MLHWKYFASTALSLYTELGKLEEFKYRKNLPIWLKAWDIFSFDVTEFELLFCFSWTLKETLTCDITGEKKNFNTDYFYWLEVWLG